MKCSMDAGGRYSVKHNERNYDKEKWNNDGHIDYSRTELNQIHVSQPLYEFFDEQFGDALVDYNDRNRKKHPERLIGFRNAADYDKCAPENRRERAVKAYYKEQKKNVQEVIIQLGNHEDYCSLVEDIGQNNADQIHAAYLEQAFERWKKENPTMVPFCAVSHLDEVSTGTPHLHIDYLPIADSSRGLSRKVSIEGALKQIGFERSKQQKYAESPYKRWLSTYRASQEQAAQRFVDQYQLGLTIEPSEPTKASHEQPQDYKLRQAEQKRKQVEQKTEELEKKEKYMQDRALEYEFEPKGKFERESHYNARRALHERQVGLKHVEEEQALREQNFASESQRLSDEKEALEINKGRLLRKIKQLKQREEKFEEEVNNQAKEMNKDLLEENAALKEENLKIAEDYKRKIDVQYAVNSLLEDRIKELEQPEQTITPIDLGRGR